MNLKTLADTPPWEWPENTGEVLLQNLTGGEASVSDRLLSARLAGDFTVIDDTGVLGTQYASGGEWRGVLYRVPGTPQRPSPTPRMVLERVDRHGLRHRDDRSLVVPGSSGDIIRNPLHYMQNSVLCPWK